MFFSHINVLLSPFCSRTSTGMSLGWNIIKIIILVWDEEKALSWDEGCFRLKENLDRGKREEETV